MVRQTSKWGQLLLMSLVGVGLTGIATAWLYNIDEIITVNGVLVPQKGGVDIKSPVTSQMEKILVKNGDKVEANQKVLQFDVVAAKSRKLSIIEQIRLEKQKFGEQIKSNIQRERTIKRKIDLNKEILRRMKPLEESGAISEIQLLQQENQLNEREDELEQIRNRRDEIESNRKLQIERYQSESPVNDKLRNEYLRSPISGSFRIKPDNDHMLQ